MNGPDTRKTDASELINRLVEWEEIRQKTSSPPSGIPELLQKLFDRCPIEPSHETPDYLDSALFESDIAFLKHFSFFATYINDFFVKYNRAWRLQETKELDDKWSRAYLIFFNQVAIGNASINNFGSEGDCFFVHIELNLVRLLPFSEVEGFIDTVAEAVVFREGVSREEAVGPVKEATTHAMLRALWQTEPGPSWFLAQYERAQIVDKWNWCVDEKIYTAKYGTISLEFEGSPFRYNHWRNRRGEDIG